MTAPLYGVMAQFESQENLVAAIEHVKKGGYHRLEAFTPQPSEEVTEALELKRSPLPWIVFAAALIGAGSAYGLQYWTSVIDYPVNIGGRPLHSWPLFIPITFELAVLFAALAAVFGMLGLSRLPTLYHPVFNNPGFHAASRAAFFLCIEPDDDDFDADAVMKLLEETEALDVAKVPE